MPSNQCPSSLAGSLNCVLWSSKCMLDALPCHRLCTNQWMIIDKLAYLNHYRYHAGYPGQMNTAWQHDPRGEMDVNAHIRQAMWQFGTVVLQNCYWLGWEQYQARIGKQQFRPGGMALSEWNRSSRAVKDTPVAENSALGANTTCHGGYCPPIAVSLFLLALSVSYCNWTLPRCSQLWPFIGISSFISSEKSQSVQKPHRGFHKLKAFRLS